MNNIKNKNQENVETEMLELLEKYSNGRIPPLVVEENPKQGLINGELLKIYQKGFSTKESIPLGILLALESYSSLEKKWQNGNYKLNTWTKPEWKAYCKELRSGEHGNKSCESCDIHHALLAEKEKQVIAYLCDHGMIDFAMPVLVREDVAAVIFTGQRKSKEGDIRNSRVY